MKPKDSLKLLGTLAIERGWVTQKQLDAAIDKQIKSPQSLGKILLAKGWLKKYQLEELIEIHSEKIFQEDERQFGRLAIKNKFVSKETIENSLQQQKKSNELLGEILIRNGFMKLQQCNAILKSQKRILFNKEPENSESFISCPACNLVYQINNFDHSKDLRCNNCGMIFSINVDANSIMQGNALFNDTEKTLEVERSVQLGLIVQSDDSTEDIVANPDNDYSKLNSYLKENNIVENDLDQSTTNEKFLNKDRYEVGEEIDRGGMGLILATKDLNIKRDIVTKVLLSKSSNYKVLRFIREAQINGQLEHPNIVPIHDLGMNSNDQIYFTMKWVKGETLNSILQNLEDENTKYLQKYPCNALVEIVQKVCDALSYAHSKKIIHRDLKPDNIMVGEFGEVQLMDWGLAKVIGSQENSIEELEASSVVDTDTNLLQTVEGSCVGTPSYMAPEQALGKIDQMDVRTDVYGIGGVLHSCLSLSPPISGDSFNNVLYKVTNGKINKLPKNTPPELVAIIKKAMALKSRNRYQSIQNLSKDLTAFQNGYSVSAKQDSMFEMFGKMIKRNKALSFGLIIACIVLIIGFAISTWQWKEAVKQKEIAKNNFDLALDNERKIQLEKEAGRKNLEAEKISQLKRLHESSSESVKTGREYLSQAKAKNHKFNLEIAEEKNSELFYAANSFRQALIYNNQNIDAQKGLYETAKTHFELSLWLKLFEQAESNLSDFTVAGGKPEELVKLKKELKKEKKKKEKEIRSRVTLLMDDAKNINRKIIHEAASKELISLRDKLTIDLLKDYIESSSSNCKKLAIDSLAWMGDPSVARFILPYIKKVNPVRGKNSYEVQLSAIMAICILKPKNSKFYNAVRNRIWEEPGNISSLLFQQIKLFYEPYAALMADQNVESIENNQSLMRWIQQGIKYKEANELKKAIKCFTKAIELNPKSDEAYNNRGLVKNNLGDTEGAIQDLKMSIKLDPKDAAAYSNLGSAMHKAKEYASGLKALNKSIELLPNNLSAYNNRALIKAAMGDFEGAIADHDFVINLDPDNVRSYVNRGLAKHKFGDPKSSIKDYNIALKLNPRFMEAYSNRSIARIHLKEYDKAISDLIIAIELNPRALVNYYNRGIARYNIKDYKGSLADLNRVIKINDNYEDVYHKRGVTKQALGDLKGACKDYIKSSEQNPKMWESWVGQTVMAYTLKDDKLFKFAIKKTKELHPLGPSIEKQLMISCKNSRISYEGKLLINKNILSSMDYFKRGKYFITLKMYKNAVNDIEHAIQLKEEIGINGGYYNLIFIATIKNDYERQIRYFKRWLKVNDNDYKIKNDFAWLLLTVPNKKLL